MRSANAIDLKLIPFRIFLLKTCHFIVLCYTSYFIKALVPSLVV